MEDNRRWIDKQNIIVRDLYSLFPKIYLIITIILFPLLCWFYNRSEVITSIKEAWKGFK